MARLIIDDVPNSLYEEVRQRAAAERRSLGNEVIRLLERAVAGPAQTSQGTVPESDTPIEMPLPPEPDAAHGGRRAVSQEEHAQALEALDTHRQRLRVKYGTFPDSTDVLRAERARDERRG